MRSLLLSAVALLSACSSTASEDPGLLLGDTEGEDTALAADSESIDSTTVADSDVPDTTVVDTTVADTGAADTKLADTSVVDSATKDAAADSAAVDSAVKDAVADTAPDAPKTGGYYVTGNTIYDASGKAHVFRGIARPSLEWDAKGEKLSAADFALMAGWKANVVRLSLNQNFWLSGAAGYSSTYEATVDQAVKWAEAAGMDVILDLHWSDKGDLSTYAGQQIMADNNSVTFWQSVANKYKSDTHVLFELYNEPHDVSWDIWLNGGSTGGFTVVGMQKLYDTVRATGATNLVIVSGLNYAYDLSGVPTHRVAGTNIVYNTHPYNQSGKQPSDWDTGFGFLAATDPLIATEFGAFDCGTDYYSKLTAYASTKKISWTAWAWYPGGCGFPSVISDWSGTANAPGGVIKTALAAP